MICRANQCGSHRGITLGREQARESVPRVKKFLVVIVFLVGSVFAGAELPTLLAKGSPISAVGGRPTPAASTSPSPSPTATLTPEQTSVGSPAAASTESPVSTPGPSSPTPKAQIVTTLPPVFTPTRVATPVPSVTPTREATATATSVPATPTQPVPPSSTPVPTATPIPTATPTPAYDYIVRSIREIPLASSRDIAHIQGKLIDRNGQLVKGTEFEIWSDGSPQWSAVYPPADQADGTVDFAVTRGKYAVRVVGGRSQDAGWMVTGQTGQDGMSNWTFVFQTTR